MMFHYFYLRWLRFEETIDQFAKASANRIRFEEEAKRCTFCLEGEPQAEFDLTRRAE
jgi:hypothetical protein